MPSPFVDIQIESSSFDTTELRVRVVDGREVIGQLYDFSIDIVSLDVVGFDPGPMLGAEASLVFNINGVELRRIPGVLAEVEDLLITEPDYRLVRVRLVPRAYRLTLVTTQEVFVDTTVPDLLQKKLDLVGLGGDCEARLMGTYPSDEIIIQYAESDLAFVSRRAEHVGISMFFEEKEGRDQVVFSDHNSAFSYVEGYEHVNFLPRGDTRSGVFALTLKKRVAPTHFSVRDYNYQTPDVGLFASRDIESYGGGVDEFGTGFSTTDGGQLFANTRSQECQSTLAVYHGRSDLAPIRAGARYTIDGHPTLQDVDILVTEVRHTAVMTVMNTGGMGEKPYANEFFGIPADVTYRPPRVTPVPRMEGVYSGIVEPTPGTTGKYANLDSDGRYRIRFFLDAGSGKPNSSNRIRMAQPYGGPAQGMHFPLRAGTEVIVAFLNGNPDRPIIVGTVPNAGTPSVVTSSNATVNRIQTPSGVTIDIGDGN